MNYGIPVTRITELLDGTKVNDVYLVVGGSIGIIQCAEPISSKTLYPEGYGITLGEYGLQRYDQVGKWLCKDEVWMHHGFFEEMQTWLAEEVVRFSDFTEIVKAKFPRLVCRKTRNRNNEPFEQVWETTDGRISYYPNEKRWFYREAKSSAGSGSTLEEAIANVPSSTLIYDLGE